MAVFGTIITNRVDSGRADAIRRRANLIFYVFRSSGTSKALLTIHERISAIENVHILERCPGKRINITEANELASLEANLNQRA